MAQQNLCPQRSAVQQLTQQWIKRHLIRTLVFLILCVPLLVVMREWGFLEACRREGREQESPQKHFESRFSADSAELGGDDM